MTGGDVILNGCEMCFGVLQHVSLSFFCLPENEATGSYLLNRDQTDRLRRQQNLQEPHHVQGPVWSKVSSNICV